jgi:hypothetical protein
MVLSAGLTRTDKTDAAVWVVVVRSRTNRRPRSTPGRSVYSCCCRGARIVCRSPPSPSRSKGKAQINRAGGPDKVSIQRERGRARLGDGSHIFVAAP